MQSQCDDLRQELALFLAKGISIRALGASDCLFTIPFSDNDGDPIQIAVHDQGDYMTLDDTGLIAGHLFTFGQQMQDSPPFLLLKSLATPFMLTLDFDRGVVATTVQKRELASGLTDFMKFLVTMVTAMPYIRSEPQRPRTFGSRLRARICQQYRGRSILDLVQQNYVLSGKSVETWPVDFHWWIQEHNEPVRHIYVIAADLNIIDAIGKAQRILSLALDADRDQERDHLRIIVDRQGRDSRQAATLISNYGSRLNYQVYNYEQDDERTSFLTQSVNEITGDSGAGWREFIKQGIQV